MPPPRVRVVVADDHPLFREGIERAVRERPDLELVAAAADGRAALDSIRDLEPHVAVLDLRLPGLDGIQILNAVVRDGMPSRILLLSAFGLLLAIIPGGQENRAIVAMFFPVHLVLAWAIAQPQVQPPATRVR